MSSEPDSQIIIPGQHLNNTRKEVPLSQFNQFQPPGWSKRRVGLMIIGFPVTTAAASLLAASRIGKFHGTRPTVTPSGV
jgi:hypothetical protein